MDKAAEFYSALELKFTKHRHGSGPDHYSCEMGGLVFEIYPLPTGGEPSIGTTLGFRVASVDSAVTALAHAGGRVVSEPKDSEWGRRAVIADLDGHRVELTEKLTAA